jgi:hypothetical protein
MPDGTGLFFRERWGLYIYYGLNDWNGPLENHPGREFVRRVNRQMKRTSEPLDAVLLAPDHVRVLWVLPRNECDPALNLARSLMESESPKPIEYVYFLPASSIVDYTNSIIWEERRYFEK